MKEIKGKFSNNILNLEANKDLISGALTIENGVIKLYLYDCFDELYRGEFFNSKISIWGIDFDGHYISLFQCEIINERRSLNNVGGKYSEFICRYKVSCLLPDIDHKIFNRCSFKIDGLNGWLNPYFGDVDGVEHGQISFTYNQPAPINYTIDAALDIEIYFSYSVGLIPFKFSDKAFFNLKFKEKRNFKELLELSNHYVFLFSVLWNRTANIIEFNLYSNDITITVGKDVHHPPIACLGYSINNEKEDQRVIRNSPLSFLDIKDTFQVILTHWYHFYSSGETYIIDVLSTAIFKNEFSTHEIFIDIFLGIEAISGLKQSAAEKEAFKIRVEKIITQIEDDEDKKWIEAVLTPLNTKSQREKLKQAFHENYKMLQVPHLSEESLPALLKIVHTYRNAMIHPKTKPFQIDRDTLKLLSLILKNLLTILLFKKIELPNKQIEIYIKRITHLSNYNKLKLKQI